MVAQIHSILHKRPHWQEIGSKLLLTVLIAIFVSFKTTAAQAQAVSIGDVTELRGFGRIVRDETFPAALDFDIKSYDNVETRAGRIAITFLDESTVKLTEHSELLIDEYVYDPDPSKSKMALQFASGTIRFISGNVNKLNKKNITLSTPTSQIFVRGTDFTATVDETGRSLIILLPDEFGDASGEIIVSTAAGQVTLNQPYQATTTSVYEQTPTKPVTLDITLDLIDNMLIVSPPRETQEIQEQQQTQSASYLDFNDLDVDLLAEDFLESDIDYDFTELDIDYLNVNFLEDLLDIIDDLDEEEEEQLVASVSGVNISGTKIGQDTETQITTIVDGSQIKLMRNVNHNAQVVVDGGQAYTVIFIQDGVSRVIQINGSATSVIRIFQSSG